MKFPYRAYDVQPSAARPSVTAVYRPVIPVRVIGVSNDAVFFGLVDTGADETVLPAFLATQLGVDVDRHETTPFRGIGGQVVHVSHGTVTLEVGKGRGAIRWEARCGFLDGPAVAILGQQGFLERFTATFSSEHKELTLKPTVKGTRKLAG